MFTGIVQHLGRVVTADSNPFGLAIAVDIQSWNHRPTLGDSISVDGCCLTVAEQPTSGLLQFHVVQQTLRNTTLGALKPGGSVNLEHAVTPATMLGGHVVQGHVDGVGAVISAVKNEFEWRLRVQPPPGLMDCIVAKGSIAMQGVSLTVAEVGDSWFEVALIPTTLQLTNLAALKQNSLVNLEADYIAKIVINWMQRRAAGK